MVSERLAEGRHYKFQRAFIAAGNLRRGVNWCAGYDPQNQAQADRSGVFLVEEPARQPSPVTEGKVVSVGAPFRFAKGMIAAGHLSRNAKWVASFAPENQAHATGGGWFLVEYFYVRRGSELSSLSKSRAPFTPPDADSD